MNAYAMALTSSFQLHTETIEVQADHWLAEWARFTGDRGAMGYPRRSVTEKANEGGITAGSPRPPSDLPEEVALTDKAVSKIRQRQDSILWRAIDLKYRERTPIEGMMRTLRMGRSAVKRLIARAQRAVWRERMSWQTERTGARL
jgi:hypothetical protein